MVKRDKGFAEVPGIKCGVGTSGLKESGKRDIFLAVFEKDCDFSAVFTRNDIKASPVKFSEGLKGKLRGIVANSGNANACTGKEGLEKAKLMSELAKKYTKTDGQFFVASTGIIGVPLPIEKVEKGIKEAVSNLGKASSKECAEAIMTTDTFPKIAFLNNGKYCIGGIAKGAGMICPEMATMLCFVATDAKIDGKNLKRILKNCVDRSFNAITVDGEMSTNDCVLLVSTGKVEISSEELVEFEKLLLVLLKDLAYQIVSDGEGASKILRISIKKAKTERQAKNVAKKIANSLLVKTAMFGADPNWGRIIASAGSAGEGIREDLLRLKICGETVFAGEPVEFDRLSLSKKMKEQKEIQIELDLNLGEYDFEVLSCDLTYEYVKINAEYTT